MPMAIFGPREIDPLSSEAASPPFAPQQDEGFNPGNKTRFRTEGGNAWRKFEGASVRCAFGLCEPAGLSDMKIPPGSWEIYIIQGVTKTVWSLSKCVVSLLGKSVSSNWRDADKEPCVI
jgi:hypothetical protein